MGRNINSCIAWEQGSRSSAEMGLTGEHSELTRTLNCRSMLDLRIKKISVREELLKLVKKALVTPNHWPQQYPGRHPNNTFFFKAEEMTLNSLKHRWLGKWWTRNMNW